MSDDAPGYRAPLWAGWIATGFGSGLLRPAPGTWGSLAAWAAWVALVVLIFVLPPILPLPGAAFDCLLGSLTILAVPVSVAASGLLLRETGEKDPGYIVSDEWVGMWLALWPARKHLVDALAGGGWQKATVWMFASFLLFRLFDIWKPWPLRRLEHIPGGWGVTLDDVAAGLYAGLLVHCLDTLTGVLIGLPICPPT